MKPRRFKHVYTSNLTALNSSVTGSSVLTSYQQAQQFTEKKVSKHFNYIQLILFIPGLICIKVEFTTTASVLTLLRFCLVHFPSSFISFSLKSNHINLILVIVDCITATNKSNITLLRKLYLFLYAASSPYSTPSRTLSLPHPS